MSLSLGEVDFTAFEVPSVIAFGGKQSLAVYRLPGGVRVVDALGPDDADITWRGILSGAGATDRARGLDALRIAGQPVTLAWDEFFYSVVIGDLQFEFCNSWWIPYRISCLVVEDPGAQVLSAVVSILSAVGSDLAAASSFTDVSAASLAVAAAGSAGSGTALYASANLTLQSTAQNIAATLQNSENELGAADLPTVLNGAATIATAAAASGYIARAIANFAQVTF
jgi:hypothetical protein